MYLGNLTHANNPELLRALGITRILSIGEPVSWSQAEIEKWGVESLLMIDEVQDNGIDPLTQQFDRCLEFIGESLLYLRCRIAP
jgi:dual specificity MAP kinase phosphatase